MMTATRRFVPVGMWRVRRRASPCLRLMPAAVPQTWPPNRTFHLTVRFAARG